MGQKRLKTVKQKKKDNHPIPISESHFKQNQHEGADLPQFSEHGDGKDDKNDANQFIIECCFLFFLFVRAPFLFLPHKKSPRIYYTGGKCKKRKKNMKGKKIKTKDRAQQSWMNGLH